MDLNVKIYTCQFVLKSLLFLCVALAVFIGYVIASQNEYNYFDHPAQPDNFG